MNKPYAVVSCPIETASGYGARSRDFLKALYELKKNEWDIQVLPQRWGACAWGYIDDHPEWSWIKPLYVPNNQMPKQPDYWFQITIPNEAQPVGKLFNVIVTAGIETTICDPSWIEGINRMNLTLVSSEHAKRVFETSAFEKRDQHGNRVDLIKLQKPVEVLFEGVDLAKYKFVEETAVEQTDVVKHLKNTVKESFNFLLVGHWLQGDIGEDRKNIGATIRTFLNTFKDKKSKPGLILKVSGAGNSILDRETLLEKIDKIRKSINSKDLPNIYLLHADLEEHDMNNLYNHLKVKAMLFLTKGEGFGRPLLEFSLTKKPIIVSKWSGHLDFLNEEFTVMVGGELKNVHPSAAVQNMILPESMWFSYNEAEAASKMKLVYENYDKHVELAKRQAHYSKTNFSFEKMREALSLQLDKFPKQAEIKLPQLNRIQLPTLKKV